MAYNLFTNDFAKDKQTGYPGGGAYVQAPIDTAKDAFQTNAAKAQASPLVTNTQPQKPIDTESPTDGLNSIVGLYTSPQEEERMRKASINRQRISAVADALRHIGNIYYTTQGAPPQIFNNPVAEERSRYQQEKAIRDANNAKFYSYQQMKEKQDMLRKQYDQTSELKAQKLAFEQEKFNRQQDLRELKEKNADWYKHATIEQKEKALDIQRQLAEGRITLMEAQTALARVKTAAGGFSPRKSGGSGGGRSGGKGTDDKTTTSETTYNYDKMGRKIGSTTTKRTTVNGQKQPSQTTTKKKLPGQTNSGKKKLP